MSCRASEAKWRRPSSDCNWSTHLHNRNRRRILYYNIFLLNNIIACRVLSNKLIMKYLTIKIQRFQSATFIINGLYIVRNDVFGALSTRDAFSIIL